MAAEILRASDAIGWDTWDYFLRGSTSKQDGPPAPTWLSPVLWNEVLCLQRLMGFEGLAESILRHNRLWKSWYESDTPVQDPLPGDWEHLTVWQRMLVVKVLREEQVLRIAREVVGHYLGPEFTESPQFDLEGAFASCAPTIPIIFVLSPGSDPTSLFLNFADEKKFGDRKKMLSLGQDQGPKAEEMISTAIRTGEWVYLQNCHLSVSWMPGLEKIMEDMQHKDIHPDFCLWLTSMPSPAFPVSVLQGSIKLTKEPPKGLKANLRDTFSSVINEKMWETCRKPWEWKKLLFSLVFFHGIIQERRKFGPLGWNIPYEWNNSDLIAASKCLKMYLEDFENIPWPAVHYILGSINYGGRVTDFLDQRCLSTVLNKYMDPNVLQDEYTFSSDGVYYPPTPSELASVQEYLAMLPQQEDPEVFGLHMNADITVQKAESQAVLNAIISIQPRGGSGAGGLSPDMQVSQLARDLLEMVPPLISKEGAHPTIFRTSAQGVMSSLSTVLIQEVDRFNKLLEEVKKSLIELRQAIKGEVLMSSDLEKMYDNFLYQKVPMIWTRVAYPSLKPLGSWFRDLLERIEFLRGWMIRGPPPSFWISGFFFPQGFLTGVLQTHARRHQIPIDELKFKTTVQTIDGPYLDLPADSGVYVHGLFLEGATWDRQAGSLRESRKAELYTSMPALWLECVHISEQTETEETYRCPMYKTSTRAGTLSTTGLSTNFVLNVDLASLHHEPSHWIMRGVALLCMLND
eukprot:NODE_665_length_2487_cov_73.067682_g570_i0.p1 GENE.NODE_665_length_2487_cov_73.067682_g570_i0~~NODE_665_length_2487_cov_73.067682_g570_i0.p1  ORF type:complete len:811 (+),score=165.77 NODE_665_length_2487_cov_73.067682_g570_i0:206-2434(+)